MEDSSQWMMLLRALGSLALVLALIASLAWVARRFLQTQSWSAKTFGNIRVLHSFPVGSKKKLMLVEVEDRRLLIGVGSDSISALCDLGSSDVVKSMETGT